MAILRDSLFDAFDLLLIIYFLVYSRLWKVFYDDKDRPNRYLLAKEQISRPTIEDLEVCCSTSTIYSKLGYKELGVVTYPLEKLYQLSKKIKSYTSSRNLYSLVKKMYNKG